MRLWEPGSNLILNAAVTKFIKEIEVSDSVQFDDYHSFRDWTVQNSEKFWQKLLSFSGVKLSSEPKSVISSYARMQDARWFEGASLNYAENLLRYSDDESAIVFWNERGLQERLSYKELRNKVAQFQSILKSRGVKSGARVCACVPNIPAAIIGLLAVTGLGAIWSSCSPDFSPQAMADRFSQIEPKVLISADGYLYKDKVYNLIPQISDLASKIPSLESVLVIPYMFQEHDISNLKNSELIKFDAGSNLEPEFEQVPANHPLYILFSSGTTGKPKCIVHRSIGILLEHIKEHQLEVDIKRKDKVFYNTTCGWMMWNWLVGTLYQGATVVLYDGFALHKNGDILFELVEKEGINVFGTSAGFIQKLEELNLVPKDKFNLSSLRSILSTGSRLKPESFDYVYKAIGNMHLCPIWGGTDLCGCLGISSMLLPVHRGEIQSRGLALDVDVVDENGRPIVGKEGEVVVKKPFPSMPLNFFNDADGSKYSAAYFERYPGIWHHGDLAVLTENQGMIVLGRSDDTLNPGGVRIGAAEVTSAAERVEEVVESLAVAKKSENDETIILYVILKPGVALDEVLIKKIHKEMPSPRHRPKEVIAVSDFPTTLSGKRSAKTVRDIINGKDPGNLDALANPQVIAQFKAL